MIKQQKYRAPKLQTIARIITYGLFILLGLLLVAGIWVRVFRPDWGGPAVPVISHDHVHAPATLLIQLAVKPLYITFHLASLCMLQ